MIDPSIYKIYKEEKKVFIPDFGAIIYSEATDSIDFNEHLTFDDGKVIEEIQSRQKSGKREARKALKTHLDKVKAKLDDGKSHLIRGLGYLYKDEDGSIAIQENKPKTKSTKKKSAKKDAKSDKVVPPVLPVAETDESNINDGFEDEGIEEPNVTEDFEPDDFASDMDQPTGMESEGEEVQMENFNASSSTEEDEYAYKPFLSEEDEDVQEYYKRKDDYYNEGGNRRRIWYYVGAAVLVAILAFAGLYYFVFDSDDDFRSTEVASTSTAESQKFESIQEESQGDTESETEITSNQDENGQSDASSPKTIVPSEPEKQTTSYSGNQESSSNHRTYSLILGSFRVDENANNFHKYLTDKQLDVRIFNWGGSFQFVGFEGIKGKDEALRMLAEMREEEEPTAWIIRNKQ